MECCDSVSDDGASGPYTNQPSGFCNPTSNLLHLPRDNATHQSSATQHEPGLRRRGVEEEAKREGTTLGDRCERGNGDKQDDEYAVGDPSKKEEEIRDRIDEEDEGIDEVECQIGEIVYQSDGSAYVLQSRSELPNDVVPSYPHPPIINTCHYSSSQSATLKSFHVFHLHHPKNWCHLPGDIRALLSRQSKDRAPVRTDLSEAEQVPPSRAKPILLCFLCRLLFKRVNTFRGHVSQQHNVTLSIEEQRLLSLQDTCAILQPVGSSHHPLLSFLEPKISSAHAVSTQFATTTQGHNTAGMLSQEERENLQVTEPGIPLQPSLPRAPLPTSALSPAKDPSTLGREGTQWNEDDDLRKDNRSSREGEEILSSEVVCTEKDSVSGISSSGRQEHDSEEALSNQSIPKSPNSVKLATSFMNNTKSLTDSELECGSSFNCHSPGPVSPSVQTSPTASTPKDLGNQEIAMGTKPNNLSENGSAIIKEPNGRQCNDKLAYSDLPSCHTNSQSPGTQPSRSSLEDSQADVGSRGAFLSDGGLVVGRDSVQGSSYSFGGQVIMTHSRNSCKTLKCPKCNWHYKYQQTLEAHMKEKHPDSEEGQCPYCSSGQSHPRLARGETYTCGYKPFRCQVCQYSTTTKGNLSIHMQSDKHLNNMQNLQSQTRPQAPTSQPSPLSNTPPIQTSAPSPAKIQGRASWRCEVCDYETNVARNLRIHMTSEKHTHNMLLLQQNLAHMQRQRRHNATELYRYCQAQNKLPDPSVVLPSGDILQETSQNQEEGDPPEGLFECVLCGRFFSDSLEALSQHLATQRSLPDSDWRSTTGDAHHCRLCHYATPLRANFQLHCQTDKHLQRYQLAAHLQEASSNHGNSEEDEEWLLRCVAAGIQVQLRCNACNYEANSLEKLKLHTVSSRHEASLRLYKYLQQSEATMSDSVWLHCVLCDYSTQNSLSLVQHSNSLSHQRGEGLLRLQRIQKGLKDEEEELGAIFKIRKCPAQENGDVNEMESPTEITADQEEQTKHTDREGEETETSFRGEKRQSETCVSPKHPLSASGDSDESPPPKRPRSQEDISSEQVRQCPFCRFCHADIARLRSHVMIQHAVQPTLRCPLCQDTLRSVALLRTHLTHLHSVTADCTQKLINTVIASDVLPDKMFLPVQDSSTQQIKADSSSNGMKTADEPSEDEQEKMATSQPEVSKNEKQPLEDAESTKENTAAFPCWQKGCNKVLTSSSALQTHVSHVHSQKPQNPISDRHVYKYRCSQCSLAFKTAEKLQLHSQYHAIRAATMCCLCHRNFRTLQALQKHLETSHLELSEAQLQQLCGSLLMTADLLGTEGQGLGEEQGTLEEERVKEDEESDIEEKVNNAESDVGLGREEVESNSKQSVIPHRKGPNLSTEKFLDPSRPFKCTVCKESFTQKNILLVHYNSVSHLHKVKRSVQDSSTGLPETVSCSTTTDHKPFKCSICNVAYSQSSTLEIHMRSVLHQTKARAAKLDTSGGNPASVNSMLGKAVSTANSKSMTAINNTSGTSSSMLSQLHLDQQVTEHNVSSSQNSSHSSTSEETKTKHLVDMMASTTKQQQKLLQQQQQQLVQAQAQIQQELQKKAAFLQSHLFNPALLHHFPISTDALLPLQQQQQLLLPFLIPGGEFQINPELNVKSSGLKISTAKAIASEDNSESAQQANLLSSSKQTLNGDSSHTSHQSISVAPEKKLPVPKQANGQILTPDSESNKGIDVQSNKKATSEVDDSTSHDIINNFKAQKDLNDEVSSGDVFTKFIPPRVAHDAPGNVSKALLENIGFELVMHFNENKQQCQRNEAEVLPNEETMSNAKEVHDPEVVGKLECESCGKLFSNALILKSHKEHIHQSIFPIQSLEKFAKDYREKYDKQFPCRPPTPEASLSPPSPASPPPLPSSETTHQKPVPSIPVSAATVTPPGASTPQVPLAPLPLPIDLPLFPPLMMHSMPLQGLAPPLPVHLPSVETGLTPDLSQLYQHQLTPGMLQQQQQGKRPRTRITDEQLRILRQYFDINNSPNEDQIHEMANKSGLPHKVIKHWFRNTLFKERQRNKDSPYNFSNPPITTLEDVKVDSRPSSPELLRNEYSGGRRSSRTRFTDYQLRVLQDFFDANAYPKDDEFEQLSNLLNLSTRVIVVWFQNARQKARKNYENQGEGMKESEPREFSNDRYIRTPNNTYECKKCSTVFQRIFDLINHQKKVCYKDEDEEVLGEQNDLFMDHKSYSPSEATPAPSSSCFSNCTEPTMDVKPTEKQEVDPEQPHYDAVSDSLTEDNKKEEPCDPEPCPGVSKLDESNQAPKPSNEEMQQASATNCSPSPIQKNKKGNPSSVQTSPVPSQSSQRSFTSQPVTPYHCIQCKLSFPSFEHWQEHQQMHFLVAQNHFVAPQFLDRPVDIPLMLFDPSNPLLARQVLSGAFPQMSASSPSVAAIPDSTINSLKRKLEQKSGNSSVENDWESNGDDSQRDKRMRTTITPEQLEVLYQKYLLDSNPTRQMLDHISHEVGLKKRVVQVWFQNTRARERKGQFRALGPVQAHRRCPFCRALFKAQTALDAHIRSRHWHEAKSAGYSMTMSGMTQDQEGAQFKIDPFHFSNCSLIPNPADALSCPESPTSKSLDLSSHQQRLSPKPLKSGGLNDFEGSLTAQEAFEHSKVDNYEAMSMNTAHNGKVAHEENYSAEGKPNSIDQLSCSSEREASSENEDKMSSGLVSPAISFSAKDFENDLVLDYSENSSLADPASPCPGGSHGQSFEIDKHGQKRYRTQLSNLQVRVLKACFSDYKTPTMLECEALGNDIGLAKRVVQVWFQNARAKEKKAKLSLAKQFGTESTCTERPKTECTLCSVKYSSCLSVRDHVFSSQHLAKVKEALGGQMDRDREYVDATSVCQLMTPPSMDQLKKASEVLSGVQPQSAETIGGFGQCTTQYLNLPTPSVPGLGSTSVASISSTKADLSDAPLNGLTGKHIPTSSSSLSATTDKYQVSTTNSVLTPKTSELAIQLQFSKEKNSETPTEKLEKVPVGSATQSNSSSTNKEKQESFTPATPTPKPDKEYTLEAAQLQALQAAGATDQTALLTNPLLPCLIPGFPPLFPSQIPTALSGSFLQPMFGMEGMFPYSPVLPQALMGLSPGSILQQYQHNLQGALMHHRLQLQQKQLLQHPQKTKASQISVPAHAQDLASKPEENQGTSYKEGSPSCSSGSTKKLDDGFLMSQCIVSKGTCRERGRDVCLYDCLACKVSLRGNEELIQHLEDLQHRQRAAEPPNAKEHASRLLPHVSPSSTSQPNPPSNQKSPPASQSKLSAPESPANAFNHSTSASQCSPTPSTSTALTGVAQAPCTPASSSLPVPLPSTLTSSLSGCHPKPTDYLNGCGDEAAEEQEST